MIISRRSGILLGLLILAGSSAGCQLMSLPFFFLPEPKQAPECKLASEEKDKIVKVVILANMSSQKNLDFVHVDRDLAGAVSQALKDGFTRNKEKIVIIPNSFVEKYRDENPSSTPVDVAKHFKADYLIELEINQISLYKPGSANTLFHGQADISVQVTDLNKQYDNLIYNKEYTTEYPRWREIPADGASSSAFRQTFLARIGRELSWRFTAHPNKDDFRFE